MELGESNIFIKVAVDNSLCTLGTLYYAHITFDVVYFKLVESYF